jgi:sec-independent protein translocase protein TatB
MFNVGGGELIVIAVIALIVLGPEHLPGAVRTLGRVVGEIRRIANGFEQELREALEDSEPEEDASLFRSRELSAPAQVVAEADPDGDDDTGDHAAAREQAAVPQESPEPGLGGGAAAGASTGTAVAGGFVPRAAPPDRPASDGASPNESGPDLGEERAAS